ncbi:MAG: 4Fe-4S dicluster domain-containing protein [Elusimicrobiota bacterium]|nr:4Fe-4S dicluster domain-containing protein [Elusimicrobiota bacterium]
MKRIFIDLETCYKCRKCTAKCSYFYHQSEILKTPIENFGIEKLFVYGAQYLICRRCEEKFCVNSCPNDALEKDEKGILHRYLMRCTSCKSCTVACPFGTIYPELVPYKTSQCDFCLGRLDDGKEPICVETCPEKAIKYIEIEEEAEKNIYFIGDHLAIHSIPWNKDAKIGVPK